MENKNIILNIGRQIGSGGHIIATQLATCFGYQLYDRELLNLAAKESGFSEKFFEQNDEKTGFFRTLFHACRSSARTTSIKTTCPKRAYISFKAMRF